MHTRTHTYTQYHRPLLYTHTTYLSRPRSRSRSRAIYFSNISHMSNLIRHTLTIYTHTTYLSNPIRHTLTIYIHYLLVQPNTTYPYFTHTLLTCQTQYDRPLLYTYTTYLSRSRSRIIYFSNISHMSNPIRHTLTIYTYYLLVQPNTIYPYYIHTLLTCLRPHRMWLPKTLRPMHHALDPQQN